MPYFTKTAEGEIGRVVHRSCTADYKLRPIMKKARELAKVKRGTKTPVVTQWIGISLDEIQRMKPSRDPWAVVRWPLIEKRMSRIDCLKWMQDRGFPEPPRSACVFCPLHSNAEWRRLQTQEPEEFTRAVEMEKNLQETKSKTDNFKSLPYLHRTCRPLGEIDFRSDIEKGQEVFNWNDECEGLCGV